MIKIFSSSIILLIYFILISNLLHGQTKIVKDSTKTKDSVTTSISKLSSKLDSVINRLNRIGNKESEQTGTIWFDTTKIVPIYTDNGMKTARIMIIDSVTLLIKDGYVIDVEIFSGKRVFTNMKSPVSIDGHSFSLIQKYTDFLQNKNNEDESIILQEGLFYHPVSTFYPEDGFVTLTRKDPYKTLTKNVGVNTVFDLRLYTDALGALGNEPNGIFQTDIQLKQYIHRKHFVNSGAKVFQYFKVNFTASKLDSKNSFVDSSNRISRAALMQRSNINAELLINIYNNWLLRKSVNNYYVDFGGGFSNVNLAKPKDTIQIKIQSLILEVGINLRSSSNIGFDFYTRFIKQFSPQTDFNKQDIDVNFLRIGGEVFFNPFQEQASRIFARINYTLGLDKAEKKNSYSQVQIGYSTLLSKAIGTK